MAGFDGEKYLRLLGERWVRKGGAARRPPHSPVLPAAAVFSGSGRIGGTVFRGQFETDPRLAADTAWIELLGERIELAAPPAVTQTRAEPLPGQDPAVRHVWERVATINDFHDPHLAFEATVAALVAAGALPAGAAVTPPFDGVTAAVIALESRAEHFGVTVELAPGVRTGLPYADLMPTAATARAVIRVPC